jgi:hypothetical protein
MLTFRKFVNFEVIGYSDFDFLVALTTKNPHQVTYSYLQGG